MNGNLFKSLVLVALMLLLGGGFSIELARAESGLILEVIEECDIQYSGDSCVAELKLTNNTGKLLDGEASLHIDYRGVCGDGHFDGKGIEAQFSITDNNWLNFSGWEEGTTRVSGFKIVKGETQPKLKIKTVSNLCPGEYTFILELKGTTEEEEYIAPPVVIGGGGYYAPPTIPITDTGEVTATPGEGGKTFLTNPDGSKIELIVPPGAVSINTRFIIEPVDINAVNQPNPARGLFLINGLIYSIRAEANGIPITKFNKPITLTFTYANVQIEGLDETSLKIHYWDKTLNQWVALESSEVDVDNNIVTASIEHFTLFALLGSKAEFVEEEKPTEEIGIPGRIKEIPKRITEEIKKIAEGIIPSGPVAEAEKPSVPEGEVGLLEEVAAPEEKVPQRGLASMVAAIGMAWGEISKSAFLTIVVILCLMGLALIGIREWRLFRKKRKK